MKVLDRSGIVVKKPKAGTLILAGTFMLSLYGSLTALPHFLGVVAFIFLLSSAGLGLYNFLRTIRRLPSSD